MLSEMSTYKIVTFASFPHSHSVTDLTSGSHRVTIIAKYAYNIIIIDAG